MKDIVKRQNKVGKKEITHLAEQGSGLCGSRLQLPRVWTALILLVPPELRKVGLEFGKTKQATVAKDLQMNLW